MEINLTPDGGVRKKILRSAKPDALQASELLPIADVHYEGRLVSNGEVFDSSREDGAVFTFEAGAGQVIRAWDIGVKSMKVGELALLTCQADYAYGEAGSPPEIPPGADLEFEVELVAVRPPKSGAASGGADDKSRLDEVRRERELQAAKKEEEKRKREEAKSAAAARVQAKLDAKKGGGKGGGKGKK